MKTALTYGRISTTNQEGNTSTDNQQDACRALAGERGYTVEGEYFDIFTGSSLDRPQLNRLRDRVRRGGVASVVCYDPDRLSRKAAHAYILEDFFEKYGVELLFVNAPTSKIDAGIRKLLSEIEREKITERLVTGKRNRQLQGSILGKHGMTYGYDCARVDDPKIKGGRGVLVIIPEEAYWVRRIFEWAAAGVPTTQIAHRLHDAGVPTKKDSNWRRETIRHILATTTYTGTHVANKVMCVAPTRAQDNYRGHKNGYNKPERSSQRLRDESEWIHISCPAIVSEDLWRAANERVHLNRIEHTYTTHNDHLLAAMVFCGRCRHRMTARKGGSPGSPRYYFVCRSAAHYIADKCIVPSSRVDLLGEDVWQGVVTRLRNPNLIREGIERHAREANRNQREDDDALETISTAIAKLARDEATVLDLLLNGKLSRDLLEGKASDIAKRRAGLESEYKSIMSRTSARLDAAANLQVLQDLSDAVTEELDYLADSDRRAVLQALQTRVTLYTDGTKTVECILTDGAVSLVEWICNGSKEADTSANVTTDNAVFTAMSDMPLVVQSVPFSFDIAVRA